VQSLHCVCRRQLSPGERKCRLDRYGCLELVDSRLNSIPGKLVEMRNAQGISIDGLWIDCIVLRSD